MWFEGYSSMLTLPILYLEQSCYRLYNLTTLCLNGTLSCVDFMECVVIHFVFFSTALPSRGGCGQAEHSATCRGSVALAITKLHFFAITKHVHVTVVMDNNTVIGAEPSDRLLHINEE